MTLHHKQMFSNNDIEANNNHVTFKTTIAGQAGGALTILAAVVGLSLLTLFVIALVTHFSQIVLVLYWAIFVVAGAAALLLLVWTVTKSWVWIGHATAEWSFSRAQHKRNNIYSVGVNHVAYDTTANIAVAQLAQRVTQNYRDQQQENIVDGEVVTLQSAPTFSELCHNGTLVNLAKENQSKEPKQRKVLWGYTTEGPRTVEISKVRSLIVSGKNGTGKTVTMAGLGLQFVLFGYEIVLIDPHMHHGEESLANYLAGVRNRMVCEPTDEENCIETFSLLSGEIANRKRTGDNSKPWFVIIDELPGLVRKYKGTEVHDVMNKTLTAINDEGRKFNMFMMAGGQRFKQASSGSADFRQSFAAAIQHKNDVPEVSLLMNCSPTEAMVASKLPIGQVFMNDSIESMLRMSIPLVTKEDSQWIGNIASGLYDTSMRIVQFPTERARKVTEMPEIPMRNTPEMAWEAKREAFRTLMVENAPKNRYMTEIWGAKPGDNAKYRQFQEEYQTMLEEIMEEEDARITCD